MKSLDVDLRSRRRPPRWTWFVLGLLMSGAFSSAAIAWKSQRDLSTLLVERDALRLRAAAPSKAALPPLRPLMPYDASARVALAQARAGWAPLLTSLEAMEVVGVTPISIDVSVAERQMRVDLEFADFATLLRYVDDINAGEPTPRWRLVQAQGSARLLAAGIPVATLVGTW